MEGKSKMVANENENTLKVHERISQQERSTFSARPTVIAFRYSEQKYRCAVDENCPMRFQTFQMQVDHHVRIHKAKLPFYCNRCLSWDQNSNFEDKKKLTHHIESSHRKRNKVRGAVVNGMKPKARGDNHVANQCI